MGHVNGLSWTAAELKARVILFTFLRKKINRMLKVRFVKSPTGRFGLAYSAGDVGFVPASLAEMAISEGYAVLIEEKAIETADAAPKYKKVEKAVRRKK